MTADCTPAARVTKSLLGYGVIAGPLYVIVALAQALTRHGFDLSKHSWSLLSNGALGWIQIANFVLTGLMTVAAAIGLRRALTMHSARTDSPARIWAPRLIGAYGAALIAAGAFRADPAQGFPVGSCRPRAYSHAPRRMAHPSSFRTRTADCGIGCSSVVA